MSGFGALGFPGSLEVLLPPLVAGEGASADLRGGCSRGSQPRSGLPPFPCASPSCSCRNDTGCGIGGRLRPAGPRETSRAPWPSLDRGRRGSPSPSDVKVSPKAKEAQVRLSRAVSHPGAHGARLFLSIKAEMRGRLAGSKRTIGLGGTTWDFKALVPTEARS